MEFIKKSHPIFSLNYISFPFLWAGEIWTGARLFHGLGCSLPLSLRQDFAMFWPIILTPFEASFTGVLLLPFPLMVTIVIPIGWPRNSFLIPVLALFFTNDLTMRFTFVLGLPSFLPSSPAVLGATGWHVLGAALALTDDSSSISVSSASPGTYSGALLRTPFTRSAKVDTGTPSGWCAIVCCWLPHLAHAVQSRATWPLLRQLWHRGGNTRTDGWLDIIIRFHIEKIGNRIDVIMRHYGRDAVSWKIFSECTMHE